MLKAVLTTTLASLALIAGTAVPKAFAGGPEPDFLACYKLSRFGSERIVVDVKRHSDLSSDPQTSYSVHGKHVGTCGGNTMSANYGTVITSSDEDASRAVATGAHMGLQTQSVRAGDSCRGVQFDCTTSEVSPVPSTWQCFVRNEFGNFFGLITLTQVDESTDARCQVFQDGTPVERSDAALGTGNNNPQR